MVEYIDAIDFIDPPLEEKRLHLCITRSVSNAKVKLEAFNKGLQTMQQNGRLQVLLHRHGLLD